MNFLDNFKIDNWYKLLLYIGLVGMMGTIFFPLSGFEKSSIIPLFLGCIFIGFGEWKRERYSQYIKPPNLYDGPTALITQKFQSKDPIGITLDIVGILFIILGIWRIL
jgi:hypothetical protein